MIWTLDFTKTVAENINLVKFRKHALSAQNHSLCTGMGRAEQDV